MTSRELVIRTLNHQPVARAPRDLWTTPAIESAQAEELAEIQVRFPSDIVQPELPPAKRAAARSRDGEATDAWGCSWRSNADGVAESHDPPLAESSKIAAFKPPDELLAAERFEIAARGVESATRFVLAHSDVRPFERLQALRGAKATAVDLARGTKDIRRLLAMIHEHNCRELELWGNAEVDGVAIRDHWGAGDSLVLAPAMWRELFKPLYREYCQILHDRDKFVFFISGGNIADIFSDLIKIEVDAVHSNWSSMNLDRLAKRFRGSVTFWGGMPGPETLRETSLEAVRESARRVRQTLDFGDGGVIAQVAWHEGVPCQRIAACFEQWAAPMPMHAS